MTIYNFQNPYTGSPNNTYNFVGSTTVTEVVTDIIKGTNNVSSQSNLTQVINDILKTTDNSNAFQNILQFITETIKYTSTINAFLNVTVTEIVSDLLKLNMTSNQKLLVLHTVSDLIKLTLTPVVDNAGVYMVIITDLLNMKDSNDVKLEITQMVTELVGFLMQNYVFNQGEIFVVCNELIKFKENIDVTLNVQKIITVMINELFAFYSTQYNYGEFTQNIMEQLFTDDNSSSQLNFALFLSDSFKFTNSIAENVDVSVYLNEILKMNFLINLNGQLYECYCINLENKALTRYDNYEFSSFCQFQRQYFGIKKDGIFLLEGKTDNGEDIQSKVKTGYFNIANIQTKSQGFSSLRMANDRLEAGYAIVKNDGQMIFRIYNDSGKSFDYTLNQVYDNEKFRFQIGQGLKGSMFQLELDTIGNFELKNCAIIPLVLQRKV